MLAWSWQPAQEALPSPAPPVWPAVVTAVPTGRNVVAIWSWQEPQAAIVGWVRYWVALAAVDESWHSLQLRGSCGYVTTMPWNV